MWERNKRFWAVALLGCVLLNSVVSSFYVPQFLSGGTGRNIRHLPCVSRRSGETGVCMFAFTCAKANGTHLGTCIDRFYFGSCCKIDDVPDLELFPQDNSIEDGPHPSRPYITTHAPIESNDIPEYFSRPKPIVEKKPVTTTTTSTRPSIPVTSSLSPTASKETTKKQDSTLETSTEPIRLSTFQTIQSSSKKWSTTESTLKSTTSSLSSTSSPSSIKPPEDITSSSEAISSSSQPTISSSRPFTSSTSRKPITSGSTIKPSTLQSSSSTQKQTTRQPVHTTVQTKPVSSTTPIPIRSTTSSTSETTTRRIISSIPSTRFPLRNATTTSRPLSYATTKKPPHVSTKRPGTKRPAGSATSRKPISPTKRPINTGKPSHNSSFVGKPSHNVSFTGKPYYTTLKPYPTSVKLGSTLSPTTETVLTSSNQIPSSSPTRFTSKPTFTTESAIPTTSFSQKTTATTEKTTQKRPAIASSPESTTFRPSPTTIRQKPTKISTSTIKSTVSSTQFTTTTERTKPPTAIPSTIADVTRPKPTLPPTKLTSFFTKPVSTTTTTATSESPLATTLKSTTTKSTTLSTSSSSTQATTSGIDENLPEFSTTFSDVVHEVTSKVPVSSLTGSKEPGLVHPTTLKVPEVNQSLEEVPQTTHSPGIVTWSSNSDITATKTPELSTTVPTQEEQTETEWTPITTPDGWIMIQSPTTERLPQTQEDSTVKPVAESTVNRLTSTKPTTEPTTEYATVQPTSQPVAPDTELPVPMETLDMTDYKQVCGRRLFPESRIVGGNRSSFGKWPWQISLRQLRSSTFLHKCGAALLNENWAITAAHCVENVAPGDLLVRIGEHDLSNEEEPYGYQERRIHIVASHPHFDSRTFEYDLALLRFDEPLLPFQPNVLPICLPDDDENYVGRTAYVTGWGRLYDEGPLPSVLQEVAVPVINNTVCEAMYRNAGYIEHIPHIFICAGWRNGGFDSCEGDSGGPMVIQRARDKRWILAGVISWGIGCAVPNQPGVYTRISEFRDWINKILQF